MQKVGNAGKLELLSLSETGGEAWTRPRFGFGMFFADGNRWSAGCRSGTRRPRVVRELVFIGFSGLRNGNCGVFGVSERVD